VTEYVSFEPGRKPHVSTTLTAHVRTGREEHPVGADAYAMMLFFSIDIPSRGTEARRRAPNSTRENVALT
jgi:hypothetical protein